MKKIYFITTNTYKFKKFTEFVNTPNFVFEEFAQQTPEIQAMNNREVAEFSAEWAANKFNLPVVKEDVGLYIEALNGFPGVYLNQIEKWIKSDGYLKLMAGVKNRAAYWEYAIAFCEPNKKPVSFYTQQHGEIANKIMGKNGYFTDKIFIPKGQTKTISELIDHNAYIRKDDHYKELLKYLKDNIIV